MATPNQIRDGDLTQITFEGPGRFVRPFQDHGDTQSFEWHVDCYQLAANFRPFQNTRIFSPGFVSPVELMTRQETALGTAYLVHEDQPEYTNCMNWLKFKRIYASLPVTRKEGVAVPYAFQQTSTSASYVWENPPPAPEVSEFIIPCNGWMLYEYFLESYPEVLRAPKVTAMWNTLLYVGSWPIDFSQPVIAKDSEIKIYKGSFIERATLYANVGAPRTTP